MMETTSTTGRRESRLRRAAYNRMNGLQCVLDNIDNRGNRAAILRSVESFGLLHVHEVGPGPSRVANRTVKARAA